MKKFSDQYKTGNTGRAGNSRSYLLQWLQLLTLSLTAIKNILNKIFHPVEQDINLTDKTPAVTLIANKKVSIMKAGKLIKWAFLLLFTVCATNANAQYSKTGNDTVCIGASKNYGVANSGNNFTWTVTPAANGTITPGATSNLISITWNVVGNATLQVREFIPATGCDSIVSITVVVNPKPVVTVPTPAAICAGASTTLTASGATTYTWSPATGLSATTGTSVTASPTTTTTYTVIGSNPTGCADTTTVTVTVNPKPVASASSNTPICAGQTLNLTGGAAGLIYSWTGPNGFSSTFQNPSIINATTAASGQYNLTVTNGSGCTDSTSTTVTVNPKPVTTPITHN